MPLFSIDLSGEFQSFLIVEALSAAIGIGVMKLHSGRTFVSVLGYRVSRFSDGVFIGKICTVRMLIFSATEICAELCCQSTWGHLRQLSAKFDLLMKRHG